MLPEAEPKERVRRVKTRKRKAGERARWVLFGGRTRGGHGTFGENSLSCTARIREGTLSGRVQGTCVPEKEKKESEGGGCGVGLISSTQTAGRKPPSLEKGVRRNGGLLARRKSLPGPGGRLLKLE